MMDEDDDAPPLLVSADGAPVVVEDPADVKLDPEKLPRVPITIITGMEMAN
jgi:hypothetical protein